MQKEKFVHYKLLNSDMQSEFFYDAWFICGRYLKIYFRDFRSVKIIINFIEYLFKNVYIVLL